MRSRLTRHVFRQLLAEQPITSHALYRAASRPRCRTRTPHHLTSPQRRTFLESLFGKPKKDLRRVQHDPGMEQMLELEKRIHLMVRLPEVEQLGAAFNNFIRFTDSKKHQKLEDFHVARLLQTLESIDEQMGDDDRIKSPFKRQDLSLALVVLGRGSGHMSQESNRFARKLYRRLQNEEPSEEPEQTKTAELSLFIAIMGRSGSTSEAEQTLIDFLKERQFKNRRPTFGWRSICAGYIMERNSEGLLQMLKHIEDLGWEPTARIARMTTLYFASENDVATTKSLFDPWMLVISDGGSLKPEDTREPVMNTVRQIVAFGLRNQEMTWVHEMLEAAAKVETTDTGADFASSMVQAAAVEGKPFEEIVKMLKIREKRMLEAGLQPHTDIEIINDLMNLATSLNQPYTAERYFNLVREFNCEPNARTFITQVRYRLDAGDISGAQASYQILRAMSIKDDEDWDIMNRLIQRLAQHKGMSPEAISNLAEDLSERKRIFPAATVRALCEYHIHRDEFYEAVDLLQTYAFHFSVTDRESILDLLIAISMNPESDTNRAWDTYMVWHQIFNYEAKREPRTRIMVEMFRRGRPDLATHVFTRMNSHPRKDTQPDLQTYIRALTGCAWTKEPEALEVIHNIMKLDTNIEPNTVCLNALMMAYESIGLAGHADLYWQQISTSDEGPTHESLIIAMKIFQGMPWGYKKADELWKRLIASDIQIPRPLAEAYVGALAGNGHYNEAIDIIREMPDSIGITPNDHMYGVFVNASANAQHQEVVMEWIKRHRAEIWQQIVARGWEEAWDGFRTINGIETTLRP